MAFYIYVALLTDDSGFSFRLETSESALLSVKPPDCKDIFLQCFKKEKKIRVVQQIL